MQYSVIIVVTVLFSAGCSSNTATSDKTVVDTANQPVAAVEEPAVVEKPATVEEPVVVAEEPVEVEEAIDLTAKILALLDDSALAFVDNDNLKLRITGNVKLYAPEKLEQLVKKWVVYWSDGSEESGKTTKACESVVMEGIICGFAEEILTGDHFLAYAVDAAGNEYPKALSVEIVDAFVEVTEPVVIAEAPVVVETIAPSAPTPITILLENILYEFDKTTLQDDYMTYLDETFENSVDRANMTFVIAGHADERGSNEYNLSIGERRAYAVKRYLVSLGFYEENVRIISYGEEKPMDIGHSKAAWSKNRRSVTELTQ